MRKTVILLVFILAVSAAWFLYSLFFAAPPSRRLARGLRVKVEPGGPRLAVEEREASWGIYEGGGTRIAGFRCTGEPVWLETGGKGDRGGQGAVFFATPEGALHGMEFHGGLRLLDLHVDTLLSPSVPGPLSLVGAAGPGRLLLAAGAKGRIEGFVVAGVPGEKPQDAEAEYLPLEGGPALALFPDPKGEKVAAILPGEKEGLRLAVLQTPGTPAPGEESLRLDGIAYPGVLWSGGGRYLLFSTTAGAVELYDFQARLRRWVKDMAPSVQGILGLQAVFDAAETCLFLVVPDTQGYLQIASIDLASGREYFFTSGWADHYGPALSPEGRYIAYRQSHLPGHDAEPPYGGDERVEESIYLWDFKERRTLLFGEREVPWRSEGIGPVFSGDGRCVYAVMDGVVRQYTIVGGS